MGTTFIWWCVTHQISSLVTLWSVLKVPLRVIFGAKTSLRFQGTFGGETFGHQAILLCRVAELHWILWKNTLKISRFQHDSYQFSKRLSPDWSPGFAAQSYWSIFWRSPAFAGRHNTAPAFVVEMLKLCFPAKLVDIACVWCVADPLVL